MTSSQHLEAFLAVMRTGSITSAAKALALSPSAVSQQIATLERDLGAELFVRHARRLEPGPGAEAAAEQARRVLAEIDALKLRASVQTQERVVAIGLFASLAQRIADPLQRLLEPQGITARYVIADPPVVGHQLMRGDRASSGLDIGLVFHLGAGSPAVTGAYRRDWIEDEPFDVVLPAAWGVPADASGADLAHLGWIVHHPGTADAAIMERALAFDAEGPRVVAHSDDFRASLELVRAGVGAALIPRGVLCRASSRGLDVRTNSHIRLVRGVFALSHRNAKNAAVVTAVLEAAAQAAKETAPSSR